MLHQASTALVVTTCILQLLVPDRHWLYVIIISRTSFRVNSYSIVCLNVNELVILSRRHILSLRDSNMIRTHNYLLRKRSLQPPSLAKWLSVCLQTKWLWVRNPLLSFKLQIWRLLRSRRSLTFRETIECGFTLKLARDMIITYRLELIPSSAISTNLDQFFDSKILM